MAKKQCEKVAECAGAHGLKRLIRSDTGIAVETVPMELLDFQTGERPDSQQEESEANAERLREVQAGEGLNPNEEPATDGSMAQEEDKL